ncbi:hypothetical protein ACWDYJ_26540, partial [Streptomyces sp. NPDC003042]
VCRTDRLTHARRAQLLALRERSGIRLTLLWHQPADRALARLLNGLEHQMIDELEQARAVLHPAAPSPADAQNLALSFNQDQPAESRLGPDYGPWMTARPDCWGIEVTRPARTPCPGADHTPLPETPRPDSAGREAGRTWEKVLAHRLHRIAHPPHVAALAIHALTAASTARLALIRGSDISETAAVLKIHDQPAHRHCRVHPVPHWARPLLAAAKTYGRLRQRDPDQSLFPLISSRDGEELHRTATSIRYRLPATP